jgi:hypothetical protein
MTQTYAESTAWVPKSRNLGITLDRALEFARAQRHRTVSLEHVLLALIDDPDASLVLHASEVDLNRLAAGVTAYLGGLHDRLAPNDPSDPTAAQELLRILDYAAAAAQQSRRREVSGAIVLAAIVGEGKSPAAGLLRSEGLTFEQTIRALQRASAPPQRPQVSGPPPAAPLPAPPAQRTPVEPHPPEPPRAPAARPAPATPGRPAAPAAGVQPPAPVPASGPAVQPRPAPPVPAHSAEESARQAEAQPQAEPYFPAAPIEGPAPSAPAGKAPEPRPLPQMPPIPSAEEVLASVRQRIEASKAAAAAAAVAGAPPVQPPSEGGEHSTAPVTTDSARLATRTAPVPQVSEPPAERRPSPPDWAAPRAAPAAGPPPLPPGPHADDAALEAAAPWPESLAAEEPDRAPRVASSDAYDRAPPTIAGGYPPKGAPYPEVDPPRDLESVRPAAAPGAGNAQVIEPGRLLENIPRTMLVARPEVVEVRISKADARRVSAGMAGGRAPVTHEIVVTKAMSVRLRAPDGGFWIESASPETQWIENQLGLISDEYASWQWTVTPRRRGTARLQLIVSARTVGSDGLAAESALPDQVFDVQIQTNYTLALRKLATWAAIAAAGGVVASFGGAAARLAASALSPFFGF